VRIVSCLAFLFLLGFQIFLKVGIIGYYGINKDYITANFCENISKPDVQCNGKCYLKKQLKKADEPVNNTQQPVPQKEKSEVQPFINLLSELKTAADSKAFRFAEPPAAVISQYFGSVFHPPIS